MATVLALPAEIWQTVALYMSRKTRLRLSATSRAIRKAVLPSIVENLTLKALSLEELRKALGIVQIETLKHVRKLTVNLQMQEDQSSILSFLPPIDGGHVRIFQHLVRATPKLRTLHLQIKLPVVYSSNNLYTPSNAIMWSQLATLAAATCPKLAKRPKLLLDFENLVVSSMNDIDQLFNLLKQFEEAQICHLALNFANMEAFARTPDNFVADLMARFKPLSISSSSTTISDAANEFQAGLAIVLPTQSLSLESALNITSWVSHFRKTVPPKLEFLQIVCDTEGLEDIITFLKLFEGSRTLNQVSLAFTHASAIGLLAKPDLKQFLRSLSNLVTVEVILFSNIAPWNSIQETLENLREELDEMKCRLSIETCYEEGSETFKAPRGHPVPLKAPLLDYLSIVQIAITDDMGVPDSRASRVTLPSVTEVRLGLLADPPAANTCSESVIQWYLDGLHLPFLHTLRLIVGIEPELVRVVTVHLPLFASCQRLIVSSTPMTIREEEDNFEEIRKEFMESLDRIRLERACDRLGIDLIYDW
ncbi:hypothetical protein P389DRAFT_34720 [Cystobasidium minutum MCA 4210]|uniref:uncharacterized protein n=1 Tax=Cystobasidium minutum MCA 4210 TaxID=1397322 RepID=UPI0034CF9F6E|eukprot:jgi/Rhomi1/34720/CE34719_173